MRKWLYSKIGVKLLITFSLVLVLSMVSLAYIAKQLITEFGELSASRNETNIRDNANAFLARIAHEQAMRYENTFKKFAASSAMIAKQSAVLLENMTLYGKTPLKPNEKIVVYPHNGIFSNDRSERTMVLYWGAPYMSEGIIEQINTLSHLDPFLETIKEENPESIACYVVTEPGIARYYPNIHGVDKLPPTTKFDIRNANWYVITKPENNLERKTVWSNIYLDSVDQGLLITASTPVYSKSGQYLGGAGVDITLDTIVTDIFENIPSPHRMNGLFSFLVDNQGRLIAFPPEYLDMFEIKIDRDKLVDATVILKHSLLDSSNVEIRKIGESMVENKYEVSRFVLNGYPYMISSHFLPSTGWRLGTVVPEAVILGSIQETRNVLDSTVKSMATKFTLATILFLIISIIAIAILSIKNFIRPLGKLSKGALHVKEGNLTTHVDIHTKDEIGSLAQSFNSMVDNLRDARDREKAYAENLEQEVKDRTLEIEIKNEHLKSTLQELKQEVSDRRNAENALMESEKRIKAILRVSPVGIGLVINRELGWANDTMYRMLGYEQGSLVGQNTGDLYPDDDEYERAGRELYSGLEESGTGHAESRWIRKDGTVFDCIMRVCFLDPSNPAGGHILTVTDISALKRAHEKVKESEERYRTLFENNPVETIVVDNDAKIMMHNFAKQKSEGRSPKIGDVMYKDYAGRHDLDMFEELMKCIHSGKQKEFPEVKYDKRFLHIRISPFSGGAIITSIDITERKELYQQLQHAHKMEAIGSLAGGIAHEFNNFLSVILGNAELAMADVPEWNPAKECLEQVRSASLRAKDVVRQILGFARKSVFQLMPVRISPIISETLKLIRASIPANIEIRQVLACESDAVVADPTQINQVLMNLCTNAKDAMRADGGVLEVKLEDTSLDEKSAARYEDLVPGNYVKLTVRDTGHGIDPKIIDRIFDPFFTVTSLAEGTGMGLAVVHGIIKKHKGAVKVESEEGKGTVFEVLFPLFEGSMKPEIEEKPEDLPTGTERILFVDDDEYLLEITKQMLEHLGYQTVGKTDSEKALELFKSEPDKFDLVITDMTMPRMTGDRLAEELMRIRPDLPVIICTGYSERMDEQKAKEKGIKAFAMKPLVFKDLADIVRNVLDRKMDGC